MREPERIDRIIEKIRDVWKENPDWKFSQLLVNIVNEEYDNVGALFYLEDDAFEKCLDEFRER